jgi:hypothetical protein
LGKSTGIAQHCCIRQCRAHSTQPPRKTEACSCLIVLVVLFFIIVAKHNFLHIYSCGWCHLLPLLMLLSTIRRQIGMVNVQEENDTPVLPAVVDLMLKGVVESCNSPRCPASHLPPDDHLKPTVVAVIRWPILDIDPKVQHKAIVGCTAVRTDMKPRP